MHGPMNIK